MSRVRVPQEQLGTGPLSVLSTPLPPINTPTVAGQLAGILSGGADVATRAVGFMAATQQMKNQEAILSIRNNEAAVREAEQNARQLEMDEARNASIMRGEASLAFDEVSGSIQEAFASGQMDAHIGRVPDAEALAAIADGFADPATAGFGADSEYTKEFKRKARALVTNLGLNRQVQLQEIDRQSNITAIQRDLGGVTTAEEVNAIFEQTKDTVRLTKPEWVEKVLTPALLARTDNDALAIANSLIDDPRDREAVVRKVESEQRNILSQNRQTALNYLTDQIDVAGRYDSSIIDYINFAEKNGALNADDRATYLRRVKSMEEKALEQQQKAIDFRDADNLFREQATSQLGKIASGNWWDADNVEVKVGSETRKATVDELRRMAYDGVAKNIDALNVPAEEKTRLKVQAAFTQNYAPLEFVAGAKATVQQMQALGQSTAAKDRIVLNDQMKASISAYEQARNLSPAFAASLFTNDNDRAYFENVTDYLRNNSNDLAGAINYVKTAMATGPLDSNRLRAVSKNTESMVEQYDKVGGEIEAYVIAESRRQMAHGRPADEAIERATSLVKDRLVTINGYSTYVKSREWLPPDTETFSKNATLWFDELSKAYGKVNLDLDGTPIKASDIRLKQSDNGLWMAMDSRTGEIVRTGGDLSLTAFTTRELVGLASKASIKDIIRQSEEKKAKMNAPRSVDVSASSDIGFGTF